MTRYLLILLALAAYLPGCGSMEAPTTPPPPTFPPPLPPGPPIPPPPTEPPPPPADNFLGVVPGMVRGDIEAIVGQPTADPRENADEGVDVVIYDRAGGAWMLVYRAGVLERIVWTVTGVVR